MPKYVVLTTINFDGTGDFSHFEDIMKALLDNPVFSEVEFIPIVHFMRYSIPKRMALYPIILEKMNLLFKDRNIPFYYGIFDEHQVFKTDTVLQKRLGKADQVIVISFGEDLVYPYKPYFKNGIPIKFIGEHELRCGAQLKYDNLLLRPMGLSTNQFNGIKIADGTEQEAPVAWEIVTKHDPQFAAKLLASTHSTDSNQFMLKNELVPAYFNREWDFIEFIRLFNVTPSFADNKDIVIIQSGNNIKASLAPETLQMTGVQLPDKANFISNMFQDGFIKKLEIFLPETNEPLVIQGNNHASTVIRILSGYRLSDPSFEAIHQLAKMAGVSGDNTFERCVAKNVLPFYWSTNFRFKKSTLASLKNITQLPELSISDEARHSYSIFFDPLLITTNYEGSPYPWYDRVFNTESYSKLNLKLMVEEWPVVTAYLRKNHNFYDRLEHIILEGVPFPLSNSCNISSSEQAASSSQAATTGFFAISHKNKSNDDKDISSTSSPPPFDGG